MPLNFEYVNHSTVYEFTHYIPEDWQDPIKMLHPEFLTKANAIIPPVVPSDGIAVFILGPETWFRPQNSPEKSSCGVLARRQITDGWIWWRKEKLLGWSRGRRWWSTRKIAEMSSNNSINSWGIWILFFDRLMNWSSSCLSIEPQSIRWG